MTRYIFHYLLVLDHQSVVVLMRELQGMAFSAKPYQLISTSCWQEVGDSKPDYVHM